MTLSDTRTVLCAFQCSSPGRDPGALGLLPCQTQPAPGSFPQLNTFLLTKISSSPSDNCRGIWMTVVLPWLLLSTPNKTLSLSLSEQQKKSKLSCSPRAAFASQNPQTRLVTHTCLESDFIAPPGEHLPCSLQGLEQHRDPQNTFILHILHPIALQGGPNPTQPKPWHCRATGGARTQTLAPDPP